MLFLADVITTSGFSRHLGLSMPVKSGVVQHTSITFCNPENMRVVFGNEQSSCSYLKSVITASGFGRDRDTILPGIEMVHMLSFLFSSSSWIRSLSIRNCLPSAIQP